MSMMNLALAVLIALEAVGGSLPRLCSEAETTLQREFRDTLRSPTLDGGAVAARRWAKHDLRVDVGGSDDEDQLSPHAYGERWLRVVESTVEVNVNGGFRVGLMPGQHPADQKGDIVVIFASKKLMREVRVGTLASEMSGDDRCLAIVRNRTADAAIPVEAGAVLVTSDAADDEVRTCVSGALWRVLGLFDLPLHNDTDKTFLFFNTLYAIEHLTENSLQQALSAGINDICGSK